MRNRKWKIRLIASTFAVLAVIICFNVCRSLWMVENVIPRNEVVKSPANAFSELTYKTYNGDEKKMILKSSEVKEVADGVLDFTNIISEFKISEDETGKISADKTLALTKEAKKCEFTGHVRLTTDKGLVLETEKSFVDFDKNIADGDVAVSITQNDVRLSSEKYHFDMSNKIAVLTERAIGYIGDDCVNSDQLVIELSNANKKELKKVRALGNASYQTKQYLLKAAGYIEYDKENVRAFKSVKLKYKQNGITYNISADNLCGKIKNNVLHNVSAKGHLIIKTNDTLITGDKGTLRDNVLTVTDNVVVSNIRGKVLCREAILNTVTNEMQIYNSKGIISEKKRQAG